MEASHEPLMERAFTSELWEELWQQAKDLSPLASTQRATPDRWREFYDEVAELWLPMGGSPGELGRRVTDLLWTHGVVQEGSRVLDVGSGSGMLSIPLGHRDCRVVALDESEAMLRELKREARRQVVHTVTCRRGAWDGFESRRKFDLVVAAFFPPALSPTGLRQLQRWSAGSCCVVVPTGSDPFPFRAQLWERTMGGGPPARGHTLVCLLNYLLATDAGPSMVRLSCPVQMDILLEDAVRFYAAYFHIFGHPKPAVQEVAREVLGPCSVDRRVRAAGTSRSTVIWWPSPSTV